MNVNSWDVFDTLIGRKCGTPQRLWAKIGSDYGLQDFISKRSSAESELQKGRKEYSLSDIYKSLSEQQKWDVIFCRELEQAEWQAELDNVFRIERYASRVKPEDIAVSDMYLSKQQIGALLERAGIKLKEIFVSCYGKQRTTIWKEVQKKYTVVLHTGDNQASDAQEPRKFNIVTELAETGMTVHEKAYLQWSDALAWWTRKNRLAYGDFNGVDGKLAELQIEFNVPMLLSIVQSISRLVKQNKFDRVLFLGRDGCLLNKLWDALYQDVESRYVYCSRECLRNATDGYVTYFESQLSEKSLVVDLAASLNSWLSFVGKLSYVPEVFTGIRVGSKGKINKDHLTLLSQTTTRVNNTYLEMLNYAEHWHVADVEDDDPVLDQPEEYDMDLVSAYHRLVEKLFEDTPSIHIPSPHSVADYAAKQIHNSEAFLKRTFPNHIAFELSRELPPVENDPVDNTSLSMPSHPTTKTCIVGSIDQLSLVRCETWCKSFPLAGFNGEIHMLTYRGNHALPAQLRKFGVTAHQCEHDRHVVVDRFRDLAAFAASLPESTWVISLDTTDLVCQVNPDEWLARLPEGKDIVVGSETIAIGDQWWVRKNLMDTFPEYYTELERQLLYNAGSFAGRAKAIKELCIDTYRLCTSKPYTKNNDQDAFNHLLHTPKYKDRTYFAKQSEGWCANIAASVCASKEEQEKYIQEPLPTISNGVCHVEGGVIPCFLHHYTRLKYWERQVRDRIINRKQSAT